MVLKASTPNFLYLPFILLLLLSSHSHARTSQTPKQHSGLFLNLKTINEAPKASSSSKQIAEWGFCRLHTQCTQNRCADVRTLGLRPCSRLAPISACRCVSPYMRLCGLNACTNGLECYQIKSDTGAEADMCLTKRMANILDGKKKCIDVRALAHLEKHQLVFENHYMAKVLCDSSDSCATPGHIVQFNGKGMMMKTYCEMVGCRPVFMRVNSPRYSSGIRIESNTEGLQYTGFAAAYETYAEEATMAAMVHLGM